LPDLHVVDGQPAQKIHVSVGQPLSLDHGPILVEVLYQVVSSAARSLEELAKNSGNGATNHYDDGTTFTADGCDALGVTEKPPRVTDDARVHCST